MKKFTNTYIFVFSSVMVIIVALLLSVTAMSLKPFQDKNIEVEKKMNILASMQIPSTARNAVDLYRKYVVESFVIDNKGNKKEGIDAFNVDMKNELSKPEDQRSLPVFVGKLANGENAYSVPLRGKGLWGPIWGYVSFEKDFNTLYGAVFDHQGETPGLGAEIATPDFQKPFIGKKIFSDSTTFTSIQVVKGGIQPGDEHAVDAISGGTITSKGLEAMLRSCLIEYEPYFLANRK